MKNQIKYILILSAFILLLPGCYTVLWTPDSNASDYYADDGYYTEDYYGGYYYYYDYPWWLYTVPSRYTNPSSDRDSEMSTIRNTDGGRSTNEDRPIINTPPPTRNGEQYNSGTSGTNAGKSNSGSSGTSVNRSSSDNNSRSSSSNNNNSTRNNNGSRGSNNGRR